MMKDRRPWRIVLGVLMLFWLTSCAAVRPVAPEVNLIDLRIGNLTLSHANLLADVRIYNPNPVPITIGSVRYNFLLNGIRVADGQSLEQIRVGAGEYADTTLRLSTGYLDLLQFSSQRKAGEAIRYAIDGSVTLSGMRIVNAVFPFHREGEFDAEMLRLR
jgi:LEA14-like dessication related protein